MKQLVEDRISPRSAPAAGLSCQLASVCTPPREVKLADESVGQRLRLPEHTHVFREGDVADRLFQCVDGALMLYKLLPDGRRQVVELIGRNDVFGLSAENVYDCSAETLVSGAVVAYPRSVIESSADLMRTLNKRMHAQICAMHDHALVLGRKSALERVATFLMRCVPGRGGYSCPGPRKSDDRAFVRLTMTRHEIADYLGLTIETVSRAFSELRRRGVITITHNEEVLITDICKVCRLTGAH